MLPAWKREQKKNGGGKLRRIGGRTLDFLGMRESSTCKNELGNEFFLAGRIGHTGRCLECLSGESLPCGQGEEKRGLWRFWDNE